MPNHEHSIPSLCGIVLVAVLLSAMARPAAAQESQSRPQDQLLSDVEPPARMSEEEFESMFADMLTRLDHPDYVERGRATDWFVSLDVDQNVFLSLLERPELSREQHYRLLRVLRRRVLKRPVGAIGISMPRNQNGPGVIISDTHAGFPAHDVLEPGDRIMRIDGTPVANDVVFDDLVKQNEAGDEIELTFKRPKRDDNGRVMQDADGNVVYTEAQTVRMKLASMYDFQTGQAGEFFQEQMRKADTWDRVYARETPMLQANDPRPGTLDELSGSIDEHTLVEELNELREEIEPGDARSVIQAQRHADRSMRALRDTLARGGLTDEERRFVIRLIQRLEALRPALPEVD